MRHPGALEDLAYSQALHRIGFVTGMDGSSPEAPRTNLIGDPYYTDGLRAVLFCDSRPFSLADLEFLDWEVELRAMLEDLPCCTSSAAAGGELMPLNLVLIGDIDAWIPAFVRQGYRNAILPPRHVFGRPQIAAAEKQALWVAAQPQEVRIWPTPIRYHDKPVWIAQAVAPLSGRFASPTGGLERPLAPQVDEARDHLLQDLYSQSVVKLGFVEGAGHASFATPPGEGVGMNYETDGLRAVMVSDRRPVGLSQIQFFDWERLAEHRGQTVDAATAP